MKLAVAAVVLASGCLISPIIPIGGGKSRSEAQHEGLGKLFPAQLTTQHKWRGEVRVAKVRVWADDEYRAQNVRWQHGFDEQLDYANQLLIPMLGVRLEADYRLWEHHAPGARLAEHLAALVGEDSGEDVVWIVGLTSSLTLVSASFEELGMANLGERHVMLRGHADLEERKAFERAFPDIDAQERANVLEARRRHKITAVLLHELAHSLGALHETAKDWVMNPAYSHLAATISDRNRELMMITLEDRLKSPTDRDPRGTAQRMLAAIRVDWGGWDPGERAMLTARLGAALEAPAPGPASGAAHGPAPAGAATTLMPPVVVDQLRHAEQLLASGNHREAAVALDPLLAAYPAHAQLRVLSCKIELARAGAKDAKAIATCERAAALSAEVEPTLEIAAARVAAGDVPGARAMLVAAEPRVATLPAARASTAWLKLAEGYRELAAITWAEDAVARAGAAAGADLGITAWARTTRVRYGIPRDGARWKLVPEDDADAFAAVHHVIALSNSSKFGEATKAAAAAEKRWPQLPGLLAARCDVEFRRGAIGAARQLCSRALAQGPSSWATYLSGVLELQNGSAAATRAGIARLREAIEIDPELSQAWRALAKAYGRAQDVAELEKLRHDYWRVFGAPL